MTTVPRVKNTIPRRAAWLAGCMAIALCAPAWAQPDDTQPDDAGPQAAPDSPSNEPGAGDGAADSADDEKTRKAQELFNEGRDLHSQLLFSKAAAKYAEALQYSDHPYIHYASSRALSAMGKNLESYKSLQKAMPGLRPEHKQEAEKFQATLYSVLAEIEVRCDESQAEVFLDQKPWLTCSGRKTETVEAGQHVIVVSKPDFVTVTQPVFLAPGKRGFIDLALVSIADSTVTERRWAWWKPYALASAGVALTAVGVFFTNSANGDYRAFDSEWSRVCASRGGCMEDSLPSLVDDLDQARVKQRLGLTLLAVGTITVATGTTLTILNRSKTYRREDASTTDVEITPLITGSGAGVSAGFSY